MNSNNEGGNIRITSPNDVRWEIDAYNDDMRIFNYNSRYPGITITKDGHIKDIDGNYLHNKADSNHTHDSRYYTEAESNNLLSDKLNRTIIGNRTTACSQDFLNLKVKTSDANGTNLVSNLGNHLILHLAVDIRDPSNMYCFTVGFVNGSQYFPATISSKALSVATNSVGTVAANGGDAAFVKQIIMAIPQIGAATL